METGGSQDARDPWTGFAMTVFNLNGLLIEIGEDLVRPLGQTSARWQVLGRAHAPTTVAQMAREIGHAPQSVQRIADVLALEGLVRYTAHPTDRRTKLVGLTDAGSDVLSAIYARQVAWSERVMPSLDERRVVRTTRAMASLAEVLRSDHADPR
jgi:DNA-binding MarR family transcriptional regulator